MCSVHLSDFFLLFSAHKAAAFSKKTNKFTIAPCEEAVGRYFFFALLRFYMESRDEFMCIFLCIASISQSLDLFIDDCVLGRLSFFLSLTEATCPARASDWARLRCLGCLARSQQRALLQRSVLSSVTATELNSEDRRIIEVGGGA